MPLSVGDVVTVRDFEGAATAEGQADFLRGHVPAGTYKVGFVWDDGDVLLESVPHDGARRHLVCRGSLVEAAIVQTQEQGDTHASLRRVFDLAVAQTKDGKGADRHGNGEAFERQPIVTINEVLGSNHGALFQVVKKANESARLAATGRKDMAKNELLGAMVYLGAAYLLLEAE
jgi:hypothetical protein